MGRAGAAEKMRRIREQLGDREAEFRQGLADEASYILRQVLGQGYRLGEIGRGEWFQEHERGS